MNTYEELRNMLPDEAAGFSFRIDDEGLWLFEAYSPAGEDCCIEGQCTSPETALAEIQSDVAYELETYDEDDHAEMWVQCRGARGVPETLQELIEDAKAIRAMLVELEKEVGGWEVPAHTDITDCPICGAPTNVTEMLVGGAVESVAVCQTCFYAASEKDTNQFWGYSEARREDIRQDMISQYVKRLDDMRDARRNMETQDWTD